MCLFFHFDERDRRKSKTIFNEHWTFTLCTYSFPNQQTTQFWTKGVSIISIYIPIVVCQDNYYWASITQLPKYPGGFEHSYFIRNVANSTTTSLCSPKLNSNVFDDSSFIITWETKANWKTSMKYLLIFFFFIKTLIHTFHFGWFHWFSIVVFNLYTIEKIENQLPCLLAICHKFPIFFFLPQLNKWFFLLAWKFLQQTKSIIFIK